MNWYLAVMKNYVGLAGRARRKEYWMFVLMYALFSLLIGLAAGIVDETVGSALVGLFTLAHLLPSVAVGVRRLHDIDRSGWWLLVGLVPVVGAIALLVFAVLDGTPGTNRFGVDPKSAR